MSFGFSVGDFVSVGQLALKSYRACKRAGGQFNEVVREVSAASIVVKDLEDQAADPSSLLNKDGARRAVELKSIVDGIVIPLRELEDLAKTYSSLSTSRKRTWDRVRFASNDISDIRSRLTFHIFAAQTFLDGLATRSLTHIEIQNNESKAALARVEEQNEDTRLTLARIEQIMTDIVHDVKLGSREPSVLSGDAWNIWNELRRELRSEGLDVGILERHREDIKKYLMGLVEQAGLQDPISTDENGHDAFECSDAVAEDSSVSANNDDHTTDGLDYSADDHDNRIDRPDGGVEDCNPGRFDCVNGAAELDEALKSFAGCTWEPEPFISLRLQAAGSPQDMITFTANLPNSRSYKQLFGRLLTLCLKVALAQPISIFLYKMILVAIGVILAWKAISMLFHAHRFSQNWAMVARPLNTTSNSDHLPEAVGHTHSTNDQTIPTTLCNNFIEPQSLEQLTRSHGYNPMASSCVYLPTELGGLYWDIFSKEAPCGHGK